MKKNTSSPCVTSLSASLLAFAAALAFGLPAHAQLYWDTNGDVAGAGTNATGTWDGLATNWSVSATGETATSTYVAGSAVIFSAGSDVVTASITASGTPSAHSITIEEGAYSFSGNISLSNSTSNDGALNVASGASVSSSGNITLQGNTAFDIEGTLSANLIGGGKILTKTGTGTLTLNDAGNSDYFVEANGGLIVLQRSHWKQLKTTTINSGGTIRLAANEQLGSSLAVNSGGTLELSSNVSETVSNLTGGGAITAGNNTSLGVTGGTFSGTISGDLDIVKTGTGTHTFSGTTTSSGNTVVSAGTYVLASTGSLTFYIGENGSNNAVTGIGTANFNGSFNFDLSNADLTDGNSWLIVDVGTLTESFASTFNVTGFTADGDIWTNGLGFSFDEATGMLTYAAIPEPSTYAFFGGLAALSCVALRRRRTTP